METDESMRCPKCKNIAVELIAPHDNGKGTKICRNCKRILVQTELKKKCEQLIKHIKRLEQVKKKLDKGEKK